MSSLVYDRNFGFGLEVRQKQGFGRVRWFGRNGVSVNRNRTFNLRQCWPLLHCLRMKSHEEKKHFSWKNILFLSERVSNIDFHNKYAPWRCNMNSFSRFKNEKLQEKYVMFRFGFGSVSAKMFRFRFGFGFGGNSCFGRTL